MGCARVMNPVDSAGKRNEIYIVCVYNVVGNENGDYLRNVKPAVIEVKDAFPDKTNQPFLNDCLKITNELRTAHNSRPIHYDDWLKKYAIKRAKDLSKGDGLSLKHMDLEKDVGENVYRAVGGDKVKNCTNVIKNWYHEKSSYKYDEHQFVPTASYFTQLMWDATDKMGCARVMKPVPRAVKIYEIYIVCVYKVAGNKPGESAFPDKTDQAFLDDCLKSTNKARTAHKTRLIKYDKELQNYAKERAKYASTGIGLSLKHMNLREDVGENIYRAVGGDKVKVCANAIKNWYSEISYYSFPVSLFVPKAGHFTQLMWDGSDKMGCARVMNPVDSAGKRNEIYIVCVYKEAGNVKGEYKANVKPAVGQHIGNFASVFDLPTLSAEDDLFDESAFPDKTDQAFLDDCLKSTNKARTAHKTSLIKYDNELQKYAKERAKYMSTGIGLALKHKNLKEDVGENIYRAVGGDKVKVCMNAIKNWYSEISYYSFPAGLFVPKAGHFTQLMWDATKKMGCARVMNPVDSAGKRNEIYIVCVYKEAGNVKGEYKVNVKSPTKKIANFAANLDLDVTTLSPADALFNEPD
ncbi:unnamed protein product, partial [Medioppia subpectinata]